MLIVYLMLQMQKAIDERAKVVDGKLAEIGAQVNCFH